MKYVLPIAAAAATLSSAPLLAHEGHGMSGAAHELVHMAWMLGPLVAVAIGALVIGDKYLRGRK